MTFDEWIKNEGFQWEGSLYLCAKQAWDAAKEDCDIKTEYERGYDDGFTVGTGAVEE